MIALWKRLCHAYKRLLCFDRGKDMTPARKRFFLYVIIYSMAISAVMRTLITTCPPWLPAQYLHTELALYGLILVISTLTLSNKSKAWLVHLSLAMQSILSVVPLLSLKKESPAMMLLPSASRPSCGFLARAVMRGCSGSHSP